MSKCCFGDGGGRSNTLGIELVNVICLKSAHIAVC